MTERRQGGGMGSVLLTYLHFMYLSVISILVILSAQEGYPFWALFDEQKRVSNDHGLKNVVVMILYEGLVIAYFRKKLFDNWKWVICENPRL